MESASAFDKTTLDKQIATLRANQAKWVSYSIKKKVALLKGLVKDLYSTKDAASHHNSLSLLSSSTQDANIHQYTKLVAQHKNTKNVLAEWSVFVVPIFRLVRMMCEILEAADKGKKLQFEKLNAKKVDNQYRVQALPWSGYDKTAFMGFSAEVWVQDGKPLSQGSEMLNADPNGKLALVLGAGNQASIGVGDALYKLINCGEVVFLKHNPVNDYLFPVYEKMMRGFINEGFFQHCTGGIEEGKYLLEQCDSVHITGSDKTFDAIVWGKNEKKGTAPFTKEITSELGCITPWIIVPGKYSKKDLVRIATEAAGALSNNCSFNCVAPKLLVTCKDWPQRDKFLEILRSTISALPLEYAYYPGAKERWQQFQAAYPKAEVFAPSGYDTDNIDPKYLPWLFITDVPQEPDQLAFTMEAWSPVLCETAISAQDTPTFLKEAVSWCNDHVWGNLSGSIFATDDTQDEHRKEFEAAVKNLRYGTVAINHWTGLCFLWGTPWGGYPGNSITDIQSGQGFVHNFLLLDNIDKTVTQCPLSLPLGIILSFSPLAKNSEDFSDALANHEYSPGIMTLGSLAWQATWN